MNKLLPAKRAQILAMLCEGASMMATSRVCDVSFNAVKKLLRDAGEAALWTHDDLVHGVKASKIQCDEVWSFCYAKNRNVAKAKAAPEGAGDVWTWTAIDADTKLIVSYFMGDRSGDSARALMCDLKRRLTNRVQITTDGWSAYLGAVWGEFGGDVDYAMLDKIYGKPSSSRSAEARYSPAPVIGVKVRCCSGNPDPAHVSTSYVERSNLSLRMHNRRFTRLTNAFSKRFESHVHMVALYTLFYNFIRIHKSLRVTPAMAAGITDKLWSFEDLVERIDYYAPEAKPRGPYKKRAA
jgi:IS1 family transposase